MKNPWTTTRVPVSIFKDAETLKEIEQSLKDIEKDIKNLKQENKNLKQENAYLKSVTEVAEEKPFPPASEQKTIAEEKLDKDLGAVRVILARRIREELIEKALKGHLSMRVYANELVHIDDEILKTYSHDDIMKPIAKSLRKEGYRVESGTTSIGGCFRYGYRVSWD